MVHGKKTTFELNNNLYLNSGMIAYMLIGCVVVVMALVFFVVYSTTDKSLDPWVSRESNNPCIMDSFYDSHDLWHLGASFGLMILAMVVNTVGLI